MTITIEVPDYNIREGIKYNWSNGFEVSVNQSEESIVIEANKSGLESLANHLLNLAQDSIPVGYHIHLDEHNGLRDQSVELVIQKI